MIEKNFYQFVDPKTGELLFACAVPMCADSAKIAQEKYEEYCLGIMLGKVKRLKFNLNERLPGETYDEYVARRKVLCDKTGNGSNHEMRRANLKAIGKEIRGGFRQLKQELKKNDAKVVSAADIVPDSEPQADRYHPKFLTRERMRVGIN